MNEEIKTIPQLVFNIRQEIENIEKIKKDITKNTQYHLFQGEFVGLGCDWTKHVVEWSTSAINDLILTIYYLEQGTRKIEQRNETKSTRTLLQ